MKKKKIFKYVGFCCMLLLLMVHEVGAGWEEMEVLKYDFEISSNPLRNQWYPWLEYNSIDDEFMLLWHASGPLRDDCDLGDEYECTADLQTIEGRRVSTDGELLGELFLLTPPDEGNKNAPRFAYNMFTNEYMTASSIAEPGGSAPMELLMARINNVGDIQYGLESLYPGGGGEIMLPIVVFNPVRREYLVVYTDRNIFNAYLKNVGFILNENGNPIHGPFEVGTQEGDFYAPRGAYNPTNDTYLIVWEDFRHVDDWTQPCDVYGALMDAEGNMLVEITIMDDAGMEDEGDQRVPVLEYNPDRNEFLVVWKVGLKPSQPDAGAIVGRIINADGTLAGSVFVIFDEPRIQHWPIIKYIEEEQKYFMVWNDMRNDGQPTGTSFFDSPAIDVYARWLDDTGSPIGDEILIAEREGVGENWKMCPRMAYSPVKKRFLIAWYDRKASGGGTAFSEAPSDVKGTLYGVPASTPCPALKIYGEHSEEVELLRYVRDSILSQTPVGQEIIRLYYEWSPAIVKTMEEDEAFKKEVKGMIDGALGLVGGEIE